MNQKIMQALNKVKVMPNLQEQAMNSLRIAAKKGNVMAKGLLNDIESGNMNSAQNTLTNYMKSQGNDVNDILKNI